MTLKVVPCGSKNSHTLISIKCWFADYCATSFVYPTRWCNPHHQQLQVLNPLNRSGKMEVTRAVLRAWKQQGHRALLFSQTIQMLNLIEAMVRRDGLEYRRFDGTLSVARRHQILTEFSQDEVRQNVHCIKGDCRRRREDVCLFVCLSAL